MLYDKMMFITRAAVFFLLIKYYEVGTFFTEYFYHDTPEAMNNLHRFCFC